MSKVLTIAVPSYNAANYLVDTIPTMLAASNSEKLEIIIVNDGSVDNTREISEKFATDYPQIIRVINKENGGHGSTINVAIKAATGMYFKVIDADDWVDSKALENLVKYLETATEDEVISPYKEVYVNSAIEKEIQLSNVNEKEIYVYKDFLRLVNKLPEMHMVTIKTNILKDNNIVIGEKMFYVDMEYIIFPTPYIKTVSYLNETVYQYRIGTATQSVNLNSFVRNRFMHEKVIVRIIEYLNKVNLDTDVLAAVQKRVMAMIDRHTKVLLAIDENNMSKKEFLNFEEKIRQRSEFYSSNSDSVLVTLLRKTNYTTYGLFSKIVKFRNNYLGRKIK